MPRVLAVGDWPGSSQRCARSRRALRATWLVVIATALAALPGAASAHEGSARLILEPDRINPGGVVTIRGEDLGADDEMRVPLVGTPARADLATISTDGQGHFTLSIQVPAGAPVGVYAVEAASAMGYSLTAALFVEGAPLIEGDGAPAGQDEGLPAIAPRPPGQAAPVAGAAATFQPVVASSSGADSDVDLVPLVAFALAIGGLGLLMWRTRRPPAAQV